MLLPSHVENAHIANFRQTWSLIRPAQPAAPRTTPARDTWYARPVKVFDNLYFVGQSEYSAWAVTTSDGIIIIDPIFDYSVEDEVVTGLRLPVLLSYDFAGEPRRWERLRARFAPIDHLPDDASPSEVRQRLRRLCGR